MASTSERTLRLLSLLQNRSHWSGADLAGRLEVSERTLRRDVDRLRDLGYPVEAQRGVDGGYRLAAGAALPPLVLDDEEAVALVVGLQAATGSGVAGIAEASVRALAKAVQVLPRPLRRRAEALSAVTDLGGWRGEEAGVAVAALTAVAQAARNTERLEFDYLDRLGQPTRRHAEPHRLVVVGRRWYLVAYDLTRHDWRTFRVDRITAPSPTGKRYPPRQIPGGDAAAFVRASIGSRPDPTYEIEVVVQAPAAVVRARIGRWMAVEPLDADACRITASTDDFAWPIMALGSLGVPFRVVDPPELRAALGAWAARFEHAIG
jgi:predicted DNA-binding transcriptional regulator YafY